ncbi:MAG: BrnT family toxin, partial [Stellaceae bacterium]
MNDVFQLGDIDDREDYGEERCNVLGMCDGTLLHVTYTERGPRIRIISARRADRPFPETPMRPMTEE